MIRKVQKVAASLPSYGFGGLVLWFLNLCGPYGPYGRYGAYGPILIFAKIKSSSFTLVQLLQPFFWRGELRGQPLPPFLSIRCEPLELCTGTFPNLVKLCLIHHARQARKDAEENVKECLRCLLPLAHEQTKFLLNVTSVSRCCLMIAFAIGPEPGPRITNLALSLSPYNTGMQKPVGWTKCPSLCMTPVTPVHILWFLWNHNQVADTLQLPSARKTKHSTLQQSSLTRHQSHQRKLCCRMKHQWRDTTPWP